MKRPRLPLPRGFVGLRWGLASFRPVMWDTRPGGTRRRVHLLWNSSVGSAGSSVQATHVIKRCRERDEPPDFQETLHFGENCEGGAGILHHTDQTHRSRHMPRTWRWPTVRRSPRCSSARWRWQRWPRWRCWRWTRAAARRSASSPAPGIGGWKTIFNQKKRISSFHPHGAHL